MSESDLIRAFLTALSIIGALGVTLLGIMVKRIYGSIDKLFSAVDAMGRRINTLELTAMKADPESTWLFRALTKDGK